MSPISLRQVIKVFYLESLSLCRQLENEDPNNETYTFLVCIALEHLIRFYVQLKDVQEKEDIADY